MIHYILKRILLFFPTLIVISLVAFTLSKFVPKDQVESVLYLRGSDEPNKDAYDKVYKELGKNKPNFYCALLPNHYPQNLNAISHEQERKLHKKLLKKGYTTESIINILNALPTQNVNLSELEDIVDNNREARFFKNLDGVTIEKRVLFFPKFVWHGLDNQYHNWVKSFFNAGFGISIADGKNALPKVVNALKWTLSITLVDLIISIILGLYVGVLLIKYEDKKWAQFLNQFLYFLFAMPIFWLATLLVVYFTTDDYGTWTNIFPSVGIDIYPGKTTMQQIVLNASNLFLPIFCLTAHSLGHSTRYLKRSLSDEMKKDYALTAFAKGMSRNEVITKHALKNALIPFITVFVSAVVSAFGGALVLEVIFNVPGVGRLLFNAISVADWNVVFCILMVIATVTVIIYLIGDILYAYFNPDIKLVS